jgi:hypothetical protein
MRLHPNSGRAPLISAPSRIHPCRNASGDADGECSSERRWARAESVVDEAEQQRQQEADQDVNRRGREHDLPRVVVEPADDHRDAEQQPTAHVEQQVAVAAGVNHWAYAPGS